MKIALAQLDPIVGAFEFNIQKIKEAYREACAQQADLLLTPELGICGYPPHDLIERPEMFDRNERALAELSAVTQGQSCALAVGHVARNPSEQGRAAQNRVTVLHGGKPVFTQAKLLLPTYDVFDEARYFEPGDAVRLWSWKGHQIAFAICEDLWSHDSAFGRKLYGRDPVIDYQRNGAALILSLSASPYEWGKLNRRLQIHEEVARRLHVPLIYVNQVGATDEILFDGGSFALNAEGKLAGRLPIFKPAFGILDVEFAKGRTDLCWEVPSADLREDLLPDEIEILARGLVCGIREYFKRTGFKSAVIGLSGGIDSSVVAALAVHALGTENVIGIAMPSQYSSAHSIEDAELLAKSLGMKLKFQSIKFLFSSAKRELVQGKSELAPIALENLQSRLRGLILMTLANDLNALVLTTGNKSELATGYCTLYGDMVGALAPIGDLVKTQVYALGQFINKTWGYPIPARCFTKAPSAELKPHQTDQDTLPPYELLDELVTAYVEKLVSVEELEAQFSKGPGASDLTWVRQILRRLETNEYKRRQAAPVLKITSKAFGIGRRIPIAKIWDQ